MLCLEMKILPASQLLCEWRIYCFLIDLFLGSYHVFFFCSSASVKTWHLLVWVLCVSKMTPNWIRGECLSPESSYLSPVYWTMLPFYMCVAVRIVTMNLELYSRDIFFLFLWDVRKVTLCEMGHLFVDFQQLLQQFYGLLKQSSSILCWCYPGISNGDVCYLDYKRSLIFSFKVGMLVLTGILCQQLHLGHKFSLQIQLLSVLHFMPKIHYFSVLLKTFIPPRK